MDERLSSSCNISIAKIMNGFSKIGRTSILLTTRIDGWTRKILSSDSNLYEINGNVNFMRCSKNCHKEILEVPLKSQPVPTCP